MPRSIVFFLHPLSLHPYSCLKLYFATSSSMRSSQTFNRHFRPRCFWSIENFVVFGRPQGVPKKTFWFYNPPFLSPFFPSYDSCVISTLKLHHRHKTPSLLASILLWIRKNRNYPIRTANFVRYAIDFIEDIVSLLSDILSILSALKEHLERLILLGKDLMGIYHVLKFSLISINKYFISIEILIPSYQDI